MDIRLQDYLTKIYYEAQKNDAERHRIKSSFLGDLFKNKEEPVELPSDWKPPEEEKKLA